MRLNDGCSIPVCWRQVFSSTSDPVAHSKAPHLYEPFFGSGQIFFRKTRARVEVVNDFDAELITFFRVCQNHPEELLRCMQFSVISRRHYADLVATPPSAL